MDFRIVAIVALLMCVSLVVISSTTTSTFGDPLEEPFFNDKTRSQVQWFVIGSLVFLFFTAIDYNKLREWTWFLYVVILIALVGLLFTDSTRNVYRWYRLPILGIYLQPSEFAKVVVVLALAWLLEKRRAQAREWSTAFMAIGIVAVPFVLIFKQPDLGTALVLFPITLVMFYFGGLHPFVVKGMLWIGGIGLLIVVLIFTKIVSYEDLRPYATHFLREYQYERLNPDTLHQRAATTAIAVGGLFGNGWRQGNYTSGGWLPYPFSDSVFSAFGESFGFVGLIGLMSLFYSLIHCCFQVTVVAKDYFGRLLAAGIGVHLAMHVIVNIGMMCGFFPITGVPLLLVTYGGSSVISTMMALGILQSIYTRRFMF
jgi:rod shape determining protein RodA